MAEKPKDKDERQFERAVEHFLRTPPQPRKPAQKQDKPKDGKKAG